MITNVRRGNILTRAEELQDKGPTHFRIQLEPQPDLTWIKQFEIHYNATLSSDRVPMDVSYGSLSIHCHKTLLEKYLPQADKLIGEANASCAEISTARAADQARLRAQEEMENRENKELLDRLRKL